MNPETRQTLIGVFGLTVVEAVALTEGFNGPVAVSYFAAVLGLVAPEALENLPISLNGGG